MGRNSILQRDMTRCYICHQRDEPLDLHHIFFGALRKKSNYYGCVVKLCHHRCHIDGENAVHRNRAVDLWLKRRCQKVLMAKEGWSMAEWRQEFYKNYLDEEETQNVKRQ